MANMSYCRFQNTLKDLQDCNRAGLTHTESIEEARAALKLYQLCTEIVDNFDEGDLGEQLKELVEEDAELDKEESA